VVDAACLLVSEIGHRVDEPRVADVQLGLEARSVEDVRSQVDRVFRDQLARLPELREDLLHGRVVVY
jgi:S-adenosylmethionine synthetase